MNKIIALVQRTIQSPSSSSDDRVPTLDDEDERTDDESDGEDGYSRSRSDGEPRDDIDFPLDDTLAADEALAAGPSSPRHSHPPPRAPYRPRKRRRLQQQQQRPSSIRRPSHAHITDADAGGARDVASGAQFEKELRAELLCEICFGLMWQPVTTPCQHVSLLFLYPLSLPILSPPAFLSAIVISPSAYFWHGSWQRDRAAPRPRAFAPLANVLCTPARGVASSLTSCPADDSDRGLPLRRVPLAFSISRVSCSLFPVSRSRRRDLCVCVLPGGEACLASVLTSAGWSGLAGDSEPPQYCTSDGADRPPSGHGDRDRARWQGLHPVHSQIRISSQRCPLLVARCRCQAPLGFARISLARISALGEPARSVLWWGWGLGFGLGNGFSKLGRADVGPVVRAIVACATADDSTGGTALILC